MVREDFSAQVTYKDERPEWWEELARRGTRDPGRGHSVGKGLEVGMGLLCPRGWKGSEELGGGEPGGGRPRMSWRGRQGPDPAEPLRLGCEMWFILRAVESTGRF